MAIAMKRSFRFFLVAGMVAAFAVVTLAAMLPHVHGPNTPHHVCWIGKAQGVGFAPPEIHPEFGPIESSVRTLKVISVRPEEISFRRVQDTRAPPLSLSFLG